MLRGLDALESVKVLSINAEGVGVSASEALGNPSIVEALSVTELEVTDPATDDNTEEDAREGQSDVGVEVGVVKASLVGIVPVAEGATKEFAGEGAGATEDLVQGAEIEGVDEEDVGVVLDELNGADTLGKLVVSLSDGVRVGLLVTV